MKTFSLTKKYIKPVSCHRDFINEDHEASHWRSVGSLNRCYFYESNKWTREKIVKSLSQRWRTKDIAIKLTKIGKQMYLQIESCSDCDQNKDWDDAISKLNEWNVDDNLDARIKYHDSDDLPAFVHLNVHMNDEIYVNATDVTHYTPTIE